MEDRLHGLVNDFLTANSSNTSGTPAFDEFPVLLRLLRKVEGTSQTRWGFIPRRWAVVILSGLLLALIWLPMTRYEYAGADDGCLWRTPDWFRDLTRPPVNCSVCADLDAVERLESIVDKDVFMRNYVDPGKPVVVVDAAKAWSARGEFSLQFFRSIYLNKSRANCQFFRYQSKFHSLQHVLETASLGEKDPWYVGWSNCDGEVAEILRTHYDRPYFLPDDSESAHTDWIFMGSPGYGAHLHVDDVDYPSWQAQIRGYKKWLLYPPPECHYTCPRKFLEVILEPGDTLVVDTNWWYHKTLVVGDELSISIGSEFD